MKKQNSKNKELKAARVVVNLNREEFEFVDKIGRDALFTTGRRLTNNKILRTFVNVMRELGIDGKGLCNCNELKERLLVAIGLHRERREYPRFRKEVKVSWRKLESMDKNEVGKTMDISQGGFRVVIPAPASAGVNSAGIHKPGEVLEWTVIDPNMPDKPIKALGRIIWMEKRNEQGELEAGIGLTYVPDKDKERFSRLFYERASSSLRSAAGGEAIS